MKVLFFILSNLWYPLKSIPQLEDKQINKCEFFNNKLVVYKDSQTSDYICHTDICPHQGASLSKGRLKSINKTCNIICPYHGFVFDKNGIFKGIDNQDNEIQNKKQYIEPIDTKVVDNLLFIRRRHRDQLNNSDFTIYSPPESNNSSFNVVHGKRNIRTNYLSVVENLLDNIHISFVHSFGSSLSLPYDIKYEQLSPIHGKTTFFYEPNPSSISNLFGDNSKKTSVRVENEYILPTTTVTRVFFGREQKSIKTVFTRCISTSDNETILHWSVFRNYWMNNVMGDYVMDTLMNSVLNEDIEILNHVDPKYREGHLKTKYDITILKFRQSMKKVNKTELI
jgi:phenylpropionate dioxygenase-like ring-hydroxylating dioxygenase large terminal subunit